MPDTIASPSPAKDGTAPAAHANPSYTPIISSPPSTSTRRHLRSCTSCRQRKIKCDRQQPCSNCVKAGHEANCVYPPGPGRAAKRSRVQMDSQVVDRLSRLESMIRRLEHSKPSDTPSEVDVPFPSSASSASTPDTASLDKQLGRLVIDKTRSYYVSNVLWASLGNEIEELRDMIVEPASEDENEDSVSDQSTSLGSNTTLLGFWRHSKSLQQFHPPLALSVTLLSVFTENVVPLVRIFHMPTTTRIYWDAIASLDSLDRNIEALLFAIYYSAVTSMEDPAKAIATLGVSRKAALEKYRHATEQALARANLLNTQSIILLQAAVLFLSALRHEDDSRTTWSLTALVYHIAQAMGLHRDGTAFGLRPLETEIRRRLWYNICLLDSRSTEYHGYEPIVNERSFDTQLPLHVNDSDLTADMTTPPTERESACEMTFCLIRSNVMRTAWKVGYIPTWASNYPSEKTSLAERQALVTELKKCLQERYLRYYEDTSEPFARLCLTVGRLILARTWLAVHYPRDQRPVSRDKGIQNELFLTSIEVLELSAQLLTDRDMARWSWHLKTHTQWHTVAFVLSEICVRPPGPDCDRAWKHVCTVYDGWCLKESGRNGILWRPIKRLMAKARFVREIQKAEPNVHNRHRLTSPSSVAVSAQGTPPVLASPNNIGEAYSPSTALSNVSWGVDMNGIQNMLDMESLDPYAELFPEGLQMDMFGNTVELTSSGLHPDPVNG